MSTDIPLPEGQQTTRSGRHLRHSSFLVLSVLLIFAFTLDALSIVGSFWK